MHRVCTLIVEIQLYDVLPKSMMPRQRSLILLLLRGEYYKNRNILYLPIYFKVNH